MKHFLILICFLSAIAQADVIEGARCIAPAKPGGGFDLTCQLARDALQRSGQTRTPLLIFYEPGGIGAITFDSTIKRRPVDTKAIVAFSSGSLLNLAQGRFGPYAARDVRWLAVLGMDFGMIVVRRDSQFHSLTQLLSTLSKNPGSVVFGGSGSIGSQDWMKTALLAKSAGVSHKVIRFVAFEGGGEALAALTDDHVQVLAADAAEVARQIDQGADVRVLAVLADKRLPERWANVPTAKEQGIDFSWPIVRGVYMGPGVSDSAFREWSDRLSRAKAHRTFGRELANAGFQPGWVTGPELAALINSQVSSYRQLAIEFGLVRQY